MRHADVFRFVIIEYNYYSVVKKITAFLHHLDPDRPLMSIRAEKEDYFSLVEKLTNNIGFILIEDFQHIATLPELFAGFNQRRDQISQRPIQFICFLPAGEQNIRACKDNLRDFWSIRDLMLKFEDYAPEQTEQTSTLLQTSISNLGGLDAKSKKNELKRLRARIKVLEKDASANIELLSDLFSQITQISEELGEYQNALKWAELWVTLLRKYNRPELELVKAIGAKADNYFLLGDYDKALEIHNRSLEILERTLPAHHPDLARLYNKIAEVYDALGQYGKSLEYNQNALAIQKKVLPAEHPDLASSYNYIAVTFSHLGQLQKALEYFQKSLAIREKVLPAKHPDLANLYNNIAAVYNNLEEYQKALEFHLIALEIGGKLLPADHPNLATSYNNIATTYADLGALQKALEYNQKALAIREKVLSAYHPDLATSYNNIAWVYNNLGNLEKALDYMRQGLLILEKALPAAHPNIASAKKSLALFEKKLQEKNP